MVRSFSPFVCLFALPFFELVASTPVDNGLAGDPEVECGSASMSINLNTRNPFEGHIYVKGHYADKECRKDATANDKHASIELPFSSCGVKRERSLTPKGVFVSVTIIISFHPQFETKVDRAVKLQCFYMEAGGKAVSADLEVSALTTGPGGVSYAVPMPVCKYELLQGGPTGQPVRFASIGSPVFHKWTCSSTTVDIFCMQVYSCYVDDGSGQKVDLLDAKGCALDKYLLNNLEYSTDLMAGREAHVFKYADRTHIYFNCQIRLFVKDPGQKCERPVCPEPTRGKRAAHRQRQPSFDDLDGGAVVDVSSPGLTVADIDLEDDETDQLRYRGAQRVVNNTRASSAFGLLRSWVERNFGQSQPSPSTRSKSIRRDRDGPNEVCLTASAFGALIAVGLAGFLTSITIVTVLCFRKLRRRSSWMPEPSMLPPKMYHHY